MLWFCDGQTNAAFNEMDRHVLAGHGSEVAFVSDKVRSDLAAPEQQSISRHSLLLESTLAAKVLSRVLPDQRRGARLGIYLANGIWAAVWICAAKRLAVPCVRG